MTSDSRIAVYEYGPSAYNDFTGVVAGVDVGNPGIAQPLPYIESQSACDALDHISVEVEV